MKVLVIEDNPRLAGRIKQQLRKWYIVETALSGDEGLQNVATETFDIVLLDLGLPDTPGLEVCRQIRHLSKDLPILIVTGIDTIESRVELLNCGADDYITKPFDIAELQARVNALARRRTRSVSIDEIIIDDLIINPAQRSVVRGGKQIKLRKKEFDILEYLASHPGRVMSRQMIINHAWTSTSASWTGSVDVHIKQLRDKVDKPFSYPLIKTSYGVGYLIDASSSLKIKNG
jgi:Response regulators consisting of a CheY-like receiver domain and a winged-helix DNA-binding domain